MSFSIHTSRKFYQPLQRVIHNPNVNITSSDTISPNITIVTGYYSIPSKRSSDHYYNWIQNFMNIQSNMIIFTDSKNYEYFSNLIKDRNNCKVILFDMKDFYTNKWDEKTGTESYWEYCKKIDREGYHSIQLYKVWAEKANLLKMGAEINPFNSEYFFWVDIGSVRSEMMKNLCKYFPNFEKLKMYPLDKFFISAVQNFRQGEDNLIDEISPIYRLNGNRSPNVVDRIQGGFFGGNIEAVLKYFELYYEELQLFCDKKQFGGKEQNIMSNLYLKNKTFFNLLQPLFLPNIDIWFTYLIRFN